MDREQAIETLRANYPDACFEQLREAVDVAIEALKAQLSREGTTSDTISRQQAIDVLDSETVSTNPEHFKSSEKFIKFMDDADIASFGKWQFANGFNTALVASKLQLEKLPPAQPERTKKRTGTHACDIGRQAVKHLDLFTKTYCRDKSVKDDLLFRCNQCDFRLPDETCLVKTMARKLCPDYREFGSMGDL